MQKDNLYRSDTLPLRYMPDCLRRLHMRTGIGLRHFLIALKFLIILGSSSVAVFVQTKSGRNYFGFHHLIGTMVTMGLYYWLIEKPSDAFLIFMSLFFGVGLSWCCMSLWKLVRRIPTITADWGSYWFIWGWLPFKNPYWIYAWVLPIFTLSVAAWIDDWTLRTWLIIAAITLALRANTNAFFVQRAKERITNSMAQWETVSRHSSGQTDSTPSANYATAPTNTEKPTIATALGNIDPNLKTLLDKD